MKAIIVNFFKGIYCELPPPINNTFVQYFNERLSTNVSSTQKNALQTTTAPQKQTATTYSQLTRITGTTSTSTSTSSNEITTLVTTAITSKQPLSTATLHGERFSYRSIVYYHCIDGTILPSGKKVTEVSCIDQLLWNPLDFACNGEKN